MIPKGLVWIAGKRVRTCVLSVAVLSLVFSFSCKPSVRVRQSSTAVYSSKELAATPNQIRLRMRSLVEPFAGEIEESADGIAAATTDVSVKRAAIRWKIEGVPRLRAALFQPDPFTAVFDTWVLTYQMGSYFETGPGRADFGASANRAVDTCSRMEAELNQIVSTFVISRDVTKVRDGAKKWAMEHPIRYAIRDRESTLSRVTEQDIGVEWSVGEALAEVAVTADDVHREIQIYSDHLFRQARWEADLLKLDIQESGVSEALPLAQRAVKSSERAVDTLDALAPTIKAAAEAGGSAANAATKVTSDLPTLIASERTAAVDAINKDLKETLTFLQGERVAALDHISQERIAALKQLTEERVAAMHQVTEERVAAMGELQEIATVERIAFTKDIEQTGLRIVDRAAWRIAQIAAVVGVSLFIAALVLLFLVKKLFFSPGGLSGMTAMPRTRTQQT